MPINNSVRGVASTEQHCHQVIETADPWAKLAAAPAPDVAPEAAPEPSSSIPAGGGAQADESWAIKIDNLSFSYPGLDGRPLEGVPPVVQNMTASLRPGSRCLLIGPNGAGKTTLLKTLGGKHMVPQEALHVLGLPPFHATELTTTGALSYVGGNWERDVAFAGYAVPLQGDFPAGQMLSSLPDVDPARRQRLIKVLDINPAWRMHQVSDGQRRRVQLAMGLLNKYRVLLLDEITVDLDVLGRADLMAFLREETETRGATIVYATHIFDGLESWPTHVMYVARGQLRVFEPASALPQLQEGRLLELVEGWLREEQAQKLADKKAAEAQGGGGKGGAPAQVWNNGWAPGRLASTFKHSSNTVLRM